MKKLLFLLILLPTYVSAIEPKLPNPLGDVDTAPEFAKIVITGILGLSGAVALFMFVWGGLLWMTSAGNAQRVERGRETLIWAAIGLLVIFGSYSLLSSVFQAFTGLGQ